MDATLAVDFTGVNDRIRDTRFGAVRIKDAIVDQFRATSGGKRPSVDARAPDVRVNAHLAGTRVAISIDLSGQSLHRRGYRADKVQVEAPLKENLAAGLLLYAAWPSEAAAGASLLDPLCGSGTLPIEAALMAADVAPGLLRAEAEAKPGAAPAFGFLHWNGHDAALWAALLLEARERRGAGMKRLAAARPGAVIRGSDRDQRAVKVARDFVKRAGLHGLVTIDHAQLETVTAPFERGLLATNAPYGERLDAADVEAVYGQLGVRLREAFPRWSAVVLAGDQRQLKAVGLAPKRETDLRNGPLECVLAYYEPGAAPTARPRRAPPARRCARHRASRPRRRRPPPRRPPRRRRQTPPARPKAPRRRPSRSLPSVRAGRSAAAPSTSPTGCARTTAVWPGGCSARASPATGSTTPTCPSTTSSSTCTASGCTCRSTRRRPRSTATRPSGASPRRSRSSAPSSRRRRSVWCSRSAAGSVARRSTSAARSAATSLPVGEDDLAYLVDLGTYLDTGFFIDQRLTRRLVRRLAGGRRFLNLFAYTGTMTVNALAGGSPASTTVDLSAPYLTWAGAEPRGQRLRRPQRGVAPPRRQARRGGARCSGRQARAPRRRPRTPWSRPTASAGSPRRAASTT